MIWSMCSQICRYSATHTQTAVRVVQRRDLSCPTRPPIYFTVQIIGCVRFYSTTTGTSHHKYHPVVILRKNYSYGCSYSNHSPNRRSPFYFFILLFFSQLRFTCTGRSSTVVPVLVLYFPSQRAAARLPSGCPCRSPR